MPETEKHPVPVSVIGLLIALALLLVAVVSIAAYIWFGMQNTPATQEVETPAAAEIIEEDTATQTYTVEEKMQVMDSLQQNPEGLSEAEKRARLEALQTNN